MKSLFRVPTSLMLAGWLAAARSGAAPAEPAARERETWAGPAALTLSPDGAHLYVAAANGRRILIAETTSLKVTGSIALPGGPSGLALASDGRTLYVTCAAPVSSLAIVDLGQGKVKKEIALGHTSMSPVLSRDGRTLYVCNRFNNDVSVIDLASGRERQRIPVDREPVAAALTADGSRLLVANHLHNGRATLASVAACVTVIDTAAGKVLCQLKLPNGSGILRDIRISPDGRFACVTHVLSRFQLPTTQLERGWMNSNAMTLVDLATPTIFNTVLLDDVESGAANPWSCGWSADGTTLFVAHAGTHELSLINFAALLEKLSRLPATPKEGAVADYCAGSRVQADVPADLAFLHGLRERIRLAGKGPRATVVHGSRVYVASYYSDDLEAVDLTARTGATPKRARLSPDGPMSVLRRGELWFNDATLCFQGWQSCGSCHSDDARVDALNWDLLNDGIGNPKNTKSLLLSHRTPPAMSLGVRETAETAVRAGIRSILFTVQPDEVPQAMDEWLKSLTPIPSPFMVNQKLSPAAQRGERIFNRSQTRCATCHRQGLFTDLKQYDVGTAGAFGKQNEALDTPTLIELWRTAPYLHDGSAATLREVLVERNPDDRHGRTSQLKPEEIDDLVAYLRSL